MFNRWMLGLIIAALASMPPRVAAQRRTTVVALDALMRRFWIAAVARDTAVLDSVIVGDQPRLVLGMFIGGSGEVTRTDAEQTVARQRPPTRTLGDTIWRTYAVRRGDMTHDWFPYVARFERRCGKWRIAAISAVDKAP